MLPASGSLSKYNSDKLKLVNVSQEMIIVNFVSTFLTNSITVRPDSRGYSNSRYEILS